MFNLLIIVLIIWLVFTGGLFLNYLSQDKEFQEFHKCSKEKKKLIKQLREDAKKVMKEHGY